MADSSSPPKYGIVALSIGLLELIGIWIPFAVLPPTASAPWLLKIWGILYLAGLPSIPVAIIGLFRDKPRLVALFALILGIADIYSYA